MNTSYRTYTAILQFIQPGMEWWDVLETLMQGLCFLSFNVSFKVNTEVKIINREIFWLTFTIKDWLMSDEDNIIFSFLYSALWDGRGDFF